MTRDSAPRSGRRSLTSSAAKAFPVLCLSLNRELWVQVFRARMAYRPGSSARSNPRYAGFSFHRSLGVVSIGNGFAVFGFAHRRASQLDTVSVVN